MKNHIKIFVTTFIITLFFVNENSIAQISDTTYLPSLGDHIFTSITGVDDPFINTKFTLSFGSASFIETEIPITFGDLNKTINFKPDIFYAQGGIEFQYLIKHWAALHIKANGFASLGNNAITLASQGVDAATNFGIGWLLKIVEGDNFLLSTGIDLNTASLTFVDLNTRLDSASSTDTLSNSQLISNFQSLTTNAELRFAYKISRVFGLITKLSAGLGEVYAANSESKFKWNTGLLLSIDLRNWIEIPFGVAIGATAVSNEWRLKEAKPPIYTINLNIAFINRNDFTVGIENYIQPILVERTDQNLNFLYTKIYMSYYF